MEFLMTYGWAILVVLVVVGALAYFGVLDPTKLLPDKCNFPAGFYCTDHRAESGKIQFLLQNGLGKDVVIYSIIVNETSASPLQQCIIDADVLTADGKTLANGASDTFVLEKHATGTSCIGTITGGSKYKYDIIVTYKFVGAGTFEHTMQGELFTKIEG